VGTPQTIGPYRVERLLGTGGFATVWLAYDPGLDARVAIKVLADNWSHDPRVRERFVAEGRLLWQLDDERVLRVHGVGELEEGRPYLVTAWADRGSLADRLAQRPPLEPVRRKSSVRPRDQPLIRSRRRRRPSWIRDFTVPSGTSNRTAISRYSRSTTSCSATAGSRPAVGPAPGGHRSQRPGRGPRPRPGSWSRRVSIGGVVGHRGHPV